MGKAIYEDIKSYKITGFDLIPFASVEMISKIEDIDIDKYDLLIDFTNKHISSLLIELFLRNKKPVITGTTGHNAAFNLKMSDLATKNEVLFIQKENFAKGFNSFKSVSEKMTDFSKIEILESHHFTKKDVPSGSALVLADILKVDYNRIISLRTNDYKPVHMILMTNENEKIILIHEILDQKAFKEGFLDEFYKIVGD